MAPLVIATGTVTGQVVNSLGKPVTGLPVVAKLNAGVSTPQTISPVGQQVPGEVSTFTDPSDGSWSLALVPNNNITPANTTYTIQVWGMPDVVIQLNDTASHVYTSIAVNPSQAILAPAGQTVAQLTVTGELDAGQAKFATLPWVDITHPAYGGKGDGATDNGPALALALAQIVSTGGTIYFPPGTYNFSAAWNLSSHQFVRFMGGGPARSGGTGGASTVVFTGTSGPMVPAGGLADIELQDLYFRWPNTFNGRLVDFSSTTFAKAVGCSFIANGGGSTLGLTIGLENCTRAIIRDCVFHNAFNCIQGLNTGGDFSNAVTIEGCNFNTAANGGDVSGRCINNPGQGWDIHGNTFELGTAAGVLTAIGQTLGGSQGVTVIGNWFGDAGTGVMNIIDINGDGWLIAGNIIGGNSNASSNLINVQSGANGITVVGNRLQNSGVGVNYLGTSRDTLVLGNRFNGVTQFTNGSPTSGFLQTSTGSGGPRLFGNMQRSFQSPTETVLVSGVDATLGEHISVTLTAARLVGAPLNPVTGQHLWFTFTEGGAGAFAVTWNPVFKVTWSDAGNATGKISDIGFWYNGTNWIQLGAQAPYV